MTPQKQQFTCEPDWNQHGDCKRAVIASLLDLPIEDVPHFLQEAEGDPEAFWLGIQSFLRERGFAFLSIRDKAGHAFWGNDQPIYHEISGPSPRADGRYHSVVGCDGEVFFDPHPDGTGLAEPRSDWHFGYIVKICDAAKETP